MFSYASSRGAANPDHATGAWTEIQERQLKPLHAALLRGASFRRGARVLDVACGSGLFCETAVAQAAQVSGTGGALQDVAAARLRVPEGDFRVGVPEALPFADARFDLVAAFEVLQRVPDLPRALLEIRRVLRPGGAFCMVVDACPSISRSRLIEDFMQESLRERGGRVHPRPQLNRRVLDTLLARCSLRLEQTINVDVPWAYVDEESAMRGLLASGRMDDALSALGEEAVRELLRQALRPFRLRGAYHVQHWYRFLIARAVDV